MHLKKINHLETISPLPLEIFQFLRIRSTPRNNPTPPPPRRSQPLPKYFNPSRKIQTHPRKNQSP